MAIVLTVAMLGFGVGVYHAAGYLRGTRAPVVRPSQTSGPRLPGVIYVAQAGALYRYQDGSFTQMTSESGWTQPAASPDGSQLAVVRRYENWSDLYLMTRSGKTISHLISGYSSQVEGNHWIFYPRFSPDGSRIFFDFDPKDPYNSYRVDLAVFSAPPGAGSASWGQWTYPNDYTGGDVNPVPLRSGGLVFTRYSFDDQSKLHSQLWLQERPGSAGVALTDPSLDCGQPAVSADQTQMAMICRKGLTQTAELDVASFDASALKLGQPTALVGGQLVASPAFSPDGRTVAYLAPATAGGMFQLWTVPSAGTPTAKEITANVALDSSSAPVWLAS
ncbi:MAG TPA: hypothetical protein VGG90_05880 [Candidatus Dormibacteraeota bacterium]